MACSQVATPPDGIPEGEGPEGGSTEEGTGSQQDTPEPKRCAIS